jgi:hypothetical protein
MHGWFYCCLGKSIFLEAYGVEMLSVLGAEIVVTWDCCFGNAGQPCGYRYFKFPHHSLSFCYRFLMLESFHCCILGALGVWVAHGNIRSGFSYVEDSTLLTRNNKQATIDLVAFLGKFFGSHKSLKDTPSLSSLSRMVANLLPSWMLQSRRRLIQALLISISKVNYQWTVTVLSMCSSLVLILENSTKILQLTLKSNAFRNHHSLLYWIVIFSPAGVVLGDTWISPIDYLVCMQCWFTLYRHSV